MDYRAENSILHFVTEDDLAEVARTWPADHHPLSDAAACMRGNCGRKILDLLIPVKRKMK